MEYLVIGGNDKIIFCRLACFGEVGKIAGSAQLSPQTAGNANQPKKHKHHVIKMLLFTC